LATALSKTSVFAAAVHYRFDHFRRGVILHHLADVHAERAEWSQARIECGVVNFFGMELLVDPFVYANRQDTLEVSGARSEGQAVKCVNGSLLSVHLIGGWIRFVFFRGGQLDLRDEGERYDSLQKGDWSEFGGHDGG
jgi:hypothetical protein